MGDLNSKYRTKRAKKKKKESDRAALSSLINISANRISSKCHKSFITTD